MLILNMCRTLEVRHLVSLGGFKNVRKDFDWEGFKLELDETQFEWGTVFEIEVETVSVLISLQVSLLKSMPYPWLESFGSLWIAQGD